VALATLGHCTLLSTGGAAIDQYLLHAGPTVANLQQRRAAAKWDRHWRNDGVAAASSNQTGGAVT